jgi:hypothetical protein
MGARAQLPGVPAVDQSSRKQHDAMIDVKAEARAIKADSVLRETLRAKHEFTENRH